VAHPAGDSSDKSMAPPFPVPPGALVIKVEDESESDVPGQVTTDQELRDMFTKDVQRRLEVVRLRRSLQPCGSAQLQLQPPPAPPVRHNPSLASSFSFILNC